MKFVKDDSANPAQLWVRLHHAGQDTLGHHKNTAVWSNARFAAHAVSHAAADVFAQLLRKPLCRGPHRQTARL